MKRQKTEQRFRASRFDAAIDCSDAAEPEEDVLDMNDWVDRDTGEISEDHLLRIEDN